MQTLWTEMACCQQLGNYSELNYNGLNMSRSRHNKHQHNGEDWGAKYKCNKGYGGGVGEFPKQSARKERRENSKKVVEQELRGMEK